MKRVWTKRRRGARSAAMATAAVLVAATLTAIAAPASAAPQDATRWRTPTRSERSVPGTNLTVRPRPVDPHAASVLRGAPTVAWPAAGAAEVSLRHTVAATSGTLSSARVREREGVGPAVRVRAGNLPVTVAAASIQPAGSAASIPDTSAGGRDRAAGKIRVEVLDRSAADRAGVAGLLLTVGPATPATPTAERSAADATRPGGASISVEVDYSSFRSAYGGDWAARLGLVELPACVLSTPDRDECRTGRTLPTRNSVPTGKLTADVPVGASATVLAATAAASGSTGDYTATSLSASASWKAGGPAGDFSWTYPMAGPPAFGGPEPDLELSYSSGSIDGRTASTNNQSTWVGEGWDLAEGSVERRYKSCADDVTFTPKPYDMCWETDNAFLSLGGKTVELVKDDTTGAWHPRNDDGSRVQRLTGATNGDNDGEHWKVTQRDGTQYFFGLNRLPGWATGNEVTNSAWTAPVFGNDSGEPCHASTFASSYCSQAWRWNLDYVVDPNGNAMSYFYDTETNYYGRNRTASAATAYVRGGWLKRVDYGQRSNTLYSAPAPMRTVFDVQERCADGATCGTGDITTTTAKNWPDVPADQACKAGGTCTDLYSPTFWTRKRLSAVTTKVWVSGTTYKDVDTWALGYQFRAPGDGTTPALWLASITHTGKVGGSVTLPAVTFQGVQLENRVDAEEGIPPMYKWRVSDVYDESGGHVRVNYSARECVRSAPPTPDSNSKRCFPQYWGPEGSTAPVLDWFHKYVVTQVLQDDQAGVAGIQQTDYEYLGGGAWHYSDNELTKAKYRTWGEWRGFGKVKVTRGATGEIRSQSESLFLRGMDGDKLSSGTRQVTVTDSEGGTVTDHPALSGFTRESLSYTGVGGSVLEATINDPWISAATATHASTIGTVRSYQIGIGKTRERTALAAGGWRRTETQNSFDSYGLPSQTSDLGDTSTSADDQCNRTTYARDTSRWMLDYEVRVELVGVACTATPSYPADVISDTRTFYDGSTTFGTAPTSGDVTLTQELASYSGSTPSYVQASRATHDVYGRTLSSYDALDRRTTTAFTPATGGPALTTVVTNPLGHTMTSTLEPAWGEPTTIIDANGRRTDVTFDALGRRTGVWLADRSKSGGATPNLRFSYLVRNNAPNVVTSEELRDDGSYDTSYALFDGLLRPRQTQAPAADGGRVITDVFYDSRGLAVRTSPAYWNSGTAGTTLLTGVTDNTVPGQTLTVYDGAGRETAQIFLSYGTEKWRTTTSYGGDRVHVDPPAGGTATTTVTDSDGRTTELRQYLSGSPSGSYDATKYTYTDAGDLATVTDAAGNIWSYTYDVRGRKIRVSDPDKGIATFSYDNADQMLTSTDARGTTLAYAYDGHGRKTGLYEGSTSGTKLAAWTYDTLASGTVVKGMSASATRYVDGNAYTTTVNGYDIRYRSLGSTLTVPAVEQELAGAYRVNTGYTDTGQPLLITYPALAGLPAETLRYSYDAAGRMQTAQTNLSTLLTAATYTPYGEPLQYTLQAATGKEIAQTYFYEDGTRRLNRVLTDRSVAPTHLADMRYSYDAAGNVTQLADVPVGGSADTQCLRYDYLRRLAQAWTATDGCAALPSTSILGGPAPYWQSWSYDTTGNRLTETNYDTSSGAATTSTSSYPAAGAPRPHALASVTTGSATNTYSYDAAGNTAGRTIGASAQALTWDSEGHLAKVVEGSKTTEFLYDAEGNRFIRRDPTSVTLTIGSTELKLTKATRALSATRYYKAGSVTAVRTSAGLSFEASDRHGTAQLSINAADLSASQRRYLPFGELRGTAPTGWPGEKGFVGGTVDASTGLTHLGAREYDPDTGRFISVDPVIDEHDPQQMNGYSYADNTPFTETDPDGLWSYNPGTGHYCDSCGGYEAQIVYPKKPKAKPAKHYCDGCNYTRPVQRTYKKVYPGDLRAHDNKIAEEARRLAREYAAKKAREEAERKAKQAARALKQKEYDTCLGIYGASRSRKCGDNPAEAGKPKQNPITSLGVDKFFKHIFVTWQLCNPSTHACGKVKFQNGKVSIITAITTSPAKPSKYSLFPTVGYAARTSGREREGASVSVGRYGAGVGINKQGKPEWSDWDVSIGTSPKGGFWGTENSGIAMAGASFSTTVWSHCFIGSCK